MRLALALVAVLALALVGGAEGSGAGETGATVGRVALRFVDHTRVAHFRDGTSSARVLVTYVRYPIGGRRPLPLVVFGHGFSSTPGRYAALLDAWARAGYVVAAPVFPVESSTARGGPDESDLVNQPGDMSFVISSLLAARRLRGLVDPRRIAVAGQSDGAETAFAVAYEQRYVDPRVRAAVILSGARLPGSSPALRASPPLLAAQGTADPINPPRLTDELFRAAKRPKFLLQLLGAGHSSPYTTDARRLGVVERVTIAFLDRYLAGRTRSVRALTDAGSVPRVARLVADP
jgi:dienelactone hydrolase